MKENRERAKIQRKKKNKKEMQQVAALLKGKYSKTLILSMLIFILISIMMAVCFVIVQANRQQLKNEFINNENTKIIDVQFDREADEEGYLTFGDNGKIHQKLTAFKGKYKLANIYGFGFGMEDSTGNSHFVYGLNKPAQELFNMELDEGQAIYVGKETDMKKGTLYLQVPCIDVKKDGLESDKFKIITLDIKRTGETKQNEEEHKNKKEVKIVEADSSRKYGRLEKEGLYVDESTYKEIMATAFQMGFSSFQERYDAGEDFGIVAIHNIYIHCKSIKDVEAIAQKLDTSSYSLSYTLQDFDDLVGLVGKSAKWLLLLSFVAYGIAITVLLVNIYGHFCNMAKDMGILRHMGFSVKEIENVYSKTFEKVMGIIAVFDGILSFTVAKMLAAEIWIKVSMTTYLILLGSLILIYLAARILLRKVAGKNILVLLRFSKESE